MVVPAMVERRLCAPACGVLQLSCSFGHGDKRPRPMHRASKHRESTYRSGRSDRWIKVKKRTHPVYSRVQDQFS